MGDREDINAILREYVRTRSGQHITTRCAHCGCEPKLSEVESWRIELKLVPAEYYDEVEYRPLAYCPNCDKRRHSICSR